MSIRDVLRRAAELKADCVHFEPTGDGGQIRLRVDGRMIGPESIASEAFHELLTETRTMANIDYDTRRPQDGLLRENIDEKEWHIHVSSVFCTHGQTMTLKIRRNPSRSTLDLTDLGLLDRQITQLKRIVERPSGMILHTGPCGCGKTTTQYALLDYLNGPQRRVVTIEDYHDRVLEGIQQHVVDYASGLTFAKLTAAVARGRPDVLLVSELRDWETMETALLAAGPRTLVLGGLHTNDAASAYSRMIDMGAPPGLVATTVTGVIAQRLVARVCQSCAITYQATRAELHHLGMPKDASIELTRGAGCNKCRYTGFNGRVGVFDILEPTAAIRDLVRNNEPTNRIREAVPKRNAFFESGNELAMKGLTTLAEVYRCVPRYD